MIDLHAALKLARAHSQKSNAISGAIQLAGTVKARKSGRHATSDWMEIEKQRGISVASSVMQFEYRDHVVNLLDTPGRQGLHVRQQSVFQGRQADFCSQ